MTLTIELSPEKEAALKVQANICGCFRLLCFVHDHRAWHGGLRPFQFL
jgi:hypothetical protein